MNRRDTMRALIALAAASGPFHAYTQTAKKFRVGYLNMGSEKAAKQFVDAVLGGLNDRGYVVGQNLVVEVRYADGDPGRLLALVDELIALKPDVLVGTAVTAKGMMAKTAVIPIVFLSSADPVAEGLVKSLARPGTNATGMAYFISELIPKHVELLTDLVPKMSRLALLVDGTVPAKARDWLWERPAREAAKAKGLALVVVVADPQSVPEAFATLEKERPDAMVVGGSLWFNTIVRQLTDAANRLRLPAIYAGDFYAEAGGLMSYSANTLQNFRYAASFIDKILKGVTPADLPVEQVSRFDLVLNRKTAREIGLTIPQSILARVDRIIE